MTTTTSTTAGAATFNPMRDRRVAGALAVLLAMGGLAFANFAGSGESGGAGGYAVSVLVVAAVSALLFGRVLPNATDPGRTSWILAASALVTCVVFWSGIPFVLGMGAIYSGGQARRNAPVALGALAIVLALVGSVIG